MFAAITTLASRIRTWLSPRAVDQDFEREIEGHLELLAQENMRRGMTPEAAKRAARIRLGGITQQKETNRELRGLPILETFLQDARYAFRMLRKNPSFTGVAVLTLALGIGANAAIFSVVYATLLKPLPYAQSEQLFNVFQEQAQDATKKTGWSYLNFTELREQNRIFSELAGSQFHQLTLTGHGEPVQVDTSTATPELLSLLGEKPLAGRVFFSDDGKPGAPPVVILSEPLWRGILGADPNIIGSSINLDKRSFTVVGIMPATFRFPLAAKSEQIWIPLAHDPLFGSWMDRRSGHWLRVTGRLKPGVSITQARAALEALDARLAQEFPAENTGWVIRMVPLQDMIVGNVRPALLVLLGAVGLVLLIACANIANLLLARATSRAREIAVRATLGAGRARIIRQLLSETALLSLLGGAVGIALAYWGVHALTSLLPPDLPRVNAIRVDHGVLGFALLLSAFATCAVGLIPAFLVANSNLQASLREGGGRAGESGRARRMRSALAAAEIALAMVLLVAAGLLLRSFAKLTAMSPGFEVQHMLTAEISLPRFQYSTPQQWSTFSDDLLARIQAEPGMRDSAVAIPMPLADGFINLGFDIVGQPPLAAAESRTANYVAVSRDYFRVMGIPLLTGRLFDQRDLMSASRVSLISKAMARTYFPNQDPIGKKLSFAFPPDSGEAREIVGIVGDVRDVALGNDPGPMMYVPYAQAPFPGAVLVVKSALSPSSMATTIRQDVAKIDKDLPVTNVATMAEVIDAAVAQPRFRTLLLALFAGMALILAATGIFGVISYSVSCRTHEIGVRVALGASRAAVVGMVSRETLTLTLAGLAVGVPSALAASRLIGHMLFGVSASDPFTLLATALALGAVAALAAYVPVLRATRVDPREALRHE
jgi:predicted permease